MFESSNDRYQLVLQYLLLHYLLLIGLQPPALSTVNQNIVRFNGRMMHYQQSRVVSRRIPAHFLNASCRYNRTDL